MEWRPRHGVKLEVQSNFQIDPAIGEVIRDGIQPAVDVLYPRVVDGVSNA